MLLDHFSYAKALAKEKQKQSNQAKYEYTACAIEYDDIASACLRVQIVYRPNAGNQRSDGYKSQQP